MQAETQGGSGEIGGNNWGSAGGLRDGSARGWPDWSACGWRDGSARGWRDWSGGGDRSEWSHGTWREGTAAAAAAAAAPQPPRRFAAFGGASPHASGFGPSQWDNNEEEQEGGAGGCGSPAPQGLAAAAAAPGSATGARAGCGFAQAYASGGAAQQEYWTGTGRAVVGQGWDRNKHYPYRNPFYGVKGFWVWEPNEETWMWMSHYEYAEWPGNRLMTDESFSSDDA